MTAGLGCPRQDIIILTSFDALESVMIVLCHSAPETD